MCTCYVQGACGREGQDRINRPDFRGVFPVVGPAFPTPSRNEEPMRHFPIFLELHGRTALVLGEGEVADRKAEPLRFHHHRHMAEH